MKLSDLSEKNTYKTKIQYVIATNYRLVVDYNSKWKIKYYSHGTDRM
jgi:hypothetical protein